MHYIIKLVSIMGLQINKIQVCIIIIVTLIFLTVSVQFSKSISVQDSNNDSKTYNNPAIGITLTIPGDWELTTDLNYPMIDIIGYKESLPFSPNFNIVSEISTGTRDIQKILNLSEEKLKQELISFYLVSERLIKIDGIVCGEIVYDFYSYNSGYIRQKQLYIITNTHDVKITFADLRDSYKKSQEYFDKIQRSIKIDCDNDVNSHLIPREPYYYIPIKSISLSQTNIKLVGKNDSARISAIMRPENANPDIYWSIDHDFIKLSSKTQLTITISALKTYKGTLVVMSRVSPDIQGRCKVKVIIP